MFHCHPMTQEDPLLTMLGGAIDLSISESDGQLLEMRVHHLMLLT